MRSHAAKGVRTLGALIAGAAVVGGCSVKANEHTDLVAGKKVFVSKCGSCHTLARASTKGTVGPNLDDAFRNSLRSGLQRNTIRGVVHQQILFPEIGGVMPQNLVDSKVASDIAAYVSFAADRPGTDTGLLGSAVAAPGAGKPAIEAGGKLEIDADPTGQLAYATNKATAKAGPVRITMTNKSGTPHNIALQQGANGPVLGAGPIVPNGTSSVTATLKPGTYTFFCQVPGHRAGGMLGTLTVR